MKSVWTLQSIRIARVVTSRSACLLLSELVRDPRSSHADSSCGFDVECQRGFVAVVPVYRINLTAMTELHLALRWRPDRVTISADLYLNGSLARRFVKQFENDYSIVAILRRNNKIYLNKILFYSLFLC